MNDTFMFETDVYSVDEVINKYDTVQAIKEYLKTVQLYFEAEDIVDEIIDIIENMPAIEKEE